MSSNEDDLLFAPEETERSTRPEVQRMQGWKVLIIDDDQGIHDVTRLALNGFEFEQRPLEFLHAHSGEQARTMLRENPDIALAIVDVVMETEHAGLELVRFIREDMHNHLVRLVLRTGQPGQAPERTVIRDYDINDYKEKAELSAQKLYSTVLTSLRSYRDLTALDANRRGLEQIIRSSGELFRMPALSGFIQGVLEQLIALLYLDSDSMYVNCDSIALEHSEEQISVVAATGQFAGMVGRNAVEALPESVLSVINEALHSKSVVVRDNVYVGYFQPRKGREDVIYITSSRTLSEDDSNLIQLFLHNVSIAYENALLREEIEGTQRDMVYMLGEAIETRSKETGQHVRRVAEYCRLIAMGIGLSEREAEVLRIAAPLHDFGKIGIPDHILHKPGKLDDEEWTVMRTHAELGQEMLGRSDREILQAAATLAGHHHEKWDGSGYPRGIAGDAIHLYGRIGAVADVFDALGSKRCYKDAWITDQIIDFFREQKGSHFDPQIVDWVLDNMDQMLAVRRNFPDPGDV
jgi:response regulator RpfG family c-di-GMP phosphodiesterase